MMTRHSVIKSSFLPVFLFTLLFLFAACKDNSYGNKEKNDMDTKDVATDLNKPQADVTKERDEKFLVNAAEANFEEIMLSQLAMERSANKDVKELAQMLQDAHRKANNDLSALASSKGIAIPTAATNNVIEKYDNLNQKDARDFDQAYANKIVQAHKDVIDSFEGYTKGDNIDQDIKIWALGMLPDLRIHLTKAQAVEDQLKNQVSELVR